MLPMNRHKFLKFQDYNKFKKLIWTMYCCQVDVFRV